MGPGGLGAWGSITMDQGEMVVLVGRNREQHSLTVASSLLSLSTGVPIHVRGCGPGGALASNCGTAVPILVITDGISMEVPWMQMDK